MPLISKGQAGHPEIMMSLLFASNFRSLQFPWHGRQDMIQPETGKHILVNPKFTGVAISQKQ